ncbi:bryoporin [Notolabrus celidotus]|uniref:bryoporin n=1 Tax=Notolabrus celidotus TaxID=1203425 RepID=UPI00149015DA|nr:bryoporin [Notolabrus celidotus]XP_034567593.1 bryoporin [Notolabrus celidotus]XP_034567594.1 bryoporin [Notolabrus celidotus]XP_034567595.1 bryoporin [Notolabrus celidotus]
MPETAEAVSATLSTNRNCTIEITNVTSGYCLTNPRVYMESGFSNHSPQPTIQVNKTEVCSFVKDDNTATGAVGLLTYDLFHMQSRVCSDRMVIMFSVPFDHNLYNNRLAVGIVEQSHACDKNLYKQMYDGKDLSNLTRSDKPGSGIRFKGKYMEMRATMSSIGRAIVKVDLYDTMNTL